MFKDNVLVAVIISMLFLCFCLWMVVRSTKSLIEHDKIMFLFVFIMTSFTALLIIDWVVAPFTHLLSEEESKSIFAMDAAVVFYILGARDKNKKEKDDKN